MATTAPAAAPSVVPAGAAPVVQSWHRVATLAAAPSVSVMEVTARPGEEPPMHVHANEDEVFYMLEGALTVWVDGEEHRVEAGDCAVLPAGLPHTFAVEGESARTLVICAPGGFHGMFEALPAPIDMAVAEGVLAGFGITVVGPNPRHA